MSGFNNRKHFVHLWGNDPVAAMPEIFRMAIGQVRIVPRNVVKETPNTRTT
jgi:hypothetical protein